MNLLDGKVILVSGVGVGLGREIAAAALRQGARLVLGDLVEERLLGFCRELDPGGKRTMARQLDIADESACAALVAETRKRFGRLDGLIQVAALDSIVGDLMSSTAEDLRSCLEVNLLGSLSITRAAVPLLQQDDGGSVVMIGTVAAVREGRPHPMLAYGVSKGALRTAVWHLAQELGPKGIRVNTVAPGWKRGPVLDDFFAAEAVRLEVPVVDVVAPILRTLALRRMASDEDVGNAALFFCSDLARNVTGQTLFVDGGDVMT